MAELPSAFNLSKHEDMNDFSTIPATEYMAQVSKSEMCNCKETAKDPNGKYLKLTFKIITGKYKDRLLWTQLNLVNKNPQAVEIASKELATICKAVGLVSITDSQELHGKPMKIKVGIKEATANYPEKNEIKYYSKAEGGVSETAAPAETENPDPNAVAVPAKKPWDT